MIASQTNSIELKLDSSLEHHREQIKTGDELLKAKEWHKAVALYEKVLQQQPDLPEACFKIAIALSKLGQLSKSDDYYARFLAKEPDSNNTANDFVAQRQAGDFFFRRSEFSKATVAYQRAVELRPGDCWARINLGRILHQTNHEKAAASMLRSAIELDKKNSAAYYHLATVLLSQTEYSEAERLCHRAIELEPDNPLMVHLLEQIRSEKDPQLPSHSAAVVLATPELVEPLANAAPVEIDIGSYQYHYQQGNRHAAAKQWEESAEAYQRAIAVKDDFYLAHYALANTFTQLKRWVEAAAAYRKTIEIKPGLHPVADRLSYAIGQQQKQTPAAIQQAEKSLLEDFQNPNLHLDLAQALDRHSYIDSAMSHYETAYDLSALEASALDAPVDRPVIEKKLLDIQARRERLDSAFYDPIARPIEYAAWAIENAPNVDQVAIMPARISGFKYKPVISIVVPIYNPPETVLIEMIQSVRDQIYPYWELCVADDCSSEPHVKTVLEQYAQIDDRIRVVFRRQNGHISAASNSALAEATGEYVALLDHDDKLTPHALFEVVSLINQHPEADMIYSDEDKLTEEGERTDPSFKPDWSPDSFLSRMYVCHLGVYRKSIVDRIGGFRLGFEGSQDYDLVLRFTEHTDRIFHIPKVLYHWRMLATSEASGTGVKNYASDAGAKAIQEAMSRRGEPGIVEVSELPGVYIPRYTLKEESLISIIIPTRNLGKILDTCLVSIFEKSTYQNFEIVLMDNGTDEAESIEIIESWQKREPERFASYLYDIPFNFSRINNYALEKAKGNYLLFLNNDVEVITPDWLEAMLEQAQRPSIGAVGAKLFYPDDTLQHGGVIVGLGGVAGHSHKHLPRGHYGYSRQAIAVNNYSAVTAACLMCRREVFELVGGFEDALQVAFNDIDLCLKIQAAGYKNVWLPHVQLYHYESKSRGYEDSPEKIKRFRTEIEYMRKHWADVIDHDPCYSPNLTRAKEDYSIRLEACGEVTQVTDRTSESPLLLAANLDAPQVGKCGAVLLVSGWLIGREAAATSVDVEQAGEVIATTAVDFSRPDVAKAYPNITNAESCGFQIPLDFMSLSAPIDITLIAYFEDGLSAKVGEIKANTRSKRYRSKLVKVKPSRQNDRATSQTPATVQITDVFRANLDESLSGFSIDTPEPGTYKNFLEIAGWAIGKDHTVERIDVYSYTLGEVIFSADVNVPRPDLAKIYPTNSRAESSGFRINIDVALLNKTSKIGLQVLMSDQQKIDIGEIMMRV